MKYKIVRVKPGMRLDPRFYLLDVSGSIPVKKIKDGYYQVLIDSWRDNGLMFTQRITRDLHSLIPEYYRDAEGYNSKELKGIYRVTDIEYRVVMEESLFLIEEQQKAIRRAFYQFAKRVGLRFSSISVDFTCTDGCLLEGRVTIKRR